MISLDSPIETVLGDQTGKRKKIVDGLGLAHRRRPAPPLPAALPQDRRAHPASTSSSRGQLLTVVGEICQSEVQTYTDRRTGRPAYRLETMLSTDGPSLRMTFFAKKQHVAEWQARTLPVGRRGLFLGQVSTFQGQWQLTNPKMVLFGSGDDEDGEATMLARRRRVLPDLPAHQGRRVVGPPAGGHLRPHRPRRRARGGAGLRARRLRPGRRADGVRLDPRARRPASRSAARSGAFRFEEALVTQLVLARRRAELRGLGAQARARVARASCWRRSTSGSRSS